MSIQNKYDLALIGNTTIDEIYCLSKWANEGTSNNFQSHTTAIGGIGNIIKALQNSKLKIFVETQISKDLNGQTISKYLEKQNIDYYLHYSDRQTSEALILSNLDTKERTSFVNWGCGLDCFESLNKKTKWSHFSYLDLMPDFHFEGVRNNSDIVSADLCLSELSENTILKLLNQMQYLDYLFISESELQSLTKGDLFSLTKEYGLECLIFHKRDRTLIIRNNTQKEIIGEHKMIDNINVLGAGDAYCANFILYHLCNNFDDIKAAQFAHLQATNFIYQRANEKVQSDNSVSW